MDSRIRAPVMTPDTTVDSSKSAIAAVMAVPTAGPKRSSAATEPIARIPEPSASTMAPGSITRRYATFTPR